MRLDAIQHGPDESPVVRLFQFDFQEVEKLFHGLNILASREGEKLEVHGIAGVKAVGGTQLLLRSGSKDKGMVTTLGDASFECVLTPESWDNVAGLVEPFLKEIRGFQWLVELGQGKLLLSFDGLW